jgi:hypothetical protein
MDRVMGFEPTTSSHYQLLSKAVILSSTKGRQLLNEEGEEGEEGEEKREINSRSLLPKAH